MNALLQAASVPGPYLLVGHSYGGLLIRRYIERYGDDIVAVVLVDATHEDNRLFYVGRRHISAVPHLCGDYAP